MYLYLHIVYMYGVIAAVTLTYSNYACDVFLLLGHLLADGLTQIKMFLHKFLTHPQRYVKVTACKFCYSSIIFSGITCMISISKFCEGLFHHKVLPSEIWASQEGVFKIFRARICFQPCIELSKNYFFKKIAAKFLLEYPKVS